MSNLNKLDIDLNVNIDDLFKELTQIRDFLIEIKSLIESINEIQFKLSNHIDVIENETDIDNLNDSLRTKLLCNK